MPALQPPVVQFSGTQAGAPKRHILQSYPQGLRLPGQQPRGFAKIDWSDPIARGLSYVRLLNNWNPAPLFIDNGSDGNTAFQAISTATSISNLPAGIGLCGDGFQNSGGDLTYNVPLAGTAVCYATASWPPTDNTDHLLFQFRNSGFSHFLDVRKDSANSWNAGWFGGPDTRAAIAATGTFSAGDTFSTAVTWDASATKLYLKGSLLATNAVAADSGSTNGGQSKIGGNAAVPDVWGANVGKGGIYYVILWSRVLSNDEIAVLAADPYRFLIPAEGEMPALMSANRANAGTTNRSSIKKHPSSLCRRIETTTEYAPWLSFRLIGATP